MSIQDELHNLGAYRIKQCVNLADNIITAPVLLAIASRESNIRNITGGGYFDAAHKWHVTNDDRGCFQINQFAHYGFLAGVPGCKTGSWAVAIDPPHPAIDRSFCPQFSTACEYVHRLRHASWELGFEEGVKGPDLARFAIAAHNAGNGGALKGYREGDVDKYTTGGNYSADVLDRAIVAEAWLVERKFL